ncbi:MAG: glycoside hydrolase family 9 protein [Opitutales bacterium]|nr:glycoside hydrolase family 9 protein [Opitutales bacterium]
MIISKKSRIGAVGALAASICAFSALGATEPAGEGIRLCSVGYLPEAPKIATVVGAQEEGAAFEIIDADSGKVVYRGKLGEERDNASTKERVRMADFRDLARAGSYYMSVDGLPQSVEFRIEPDALNRSLECIMVGFYGQRCGEAVSLDWDGTTYSHAACHMEDGYLDFYDPSKKGQIRPSTGGWHDAGDHGKYTVNSAFSCAIMLAAWERNGEALAKLRLPIPESGGAIPDYLAEVKFNLDWMLSMQFEDGKVSHKLTALRFSPMGTMPEDDHQKRYFTPASKIATLDFAAVGCMAARVFEPYAPEYAAQWKEAATKAWLAARDIHEERPVFKEFHTGTYMADSDSDGKWALIEVALTLGDEYLQEWEKERLYNMVDDDNAMFSVTWDWANGFNLGLYSWLFSDRAKENPAAYERLKKDILRAADAIVTNQNNHGYGRGIRVNYWGCNGAVARTSMNLQAAYLVSEDSKYIDAAYNQIAYLYGRNPFARSFVTGDGANPPMFPHHRTSEGDGIEAPWPGHLVGGANPTETEWFDEMPSYRTNETAINWDAALAYALSMFYRPN